MQNEIGKVYNRYTIIGPAIKLGLKYHCLCRCICGVEKEVCYYNLRTGSIKSCGCLNRELAQQKIKQLNKDCDGRSKLRLHSVWLAMLARCYDNKNKSYKNYGERGIKVCAEWKNDFWQFVKDIGERPSRIHTIERRNNNDNYAKNNCYWATPHQQRINQSIRVKVRDTNIGYPKRELELAFYGVNYG